MVCCGVLPIDTLRDFLGPVELVVQRIPRPLLERAYRIRLPPSYSARGFLQALAAERGFVTGSNTPDEARAARIVLKDYVAGKLLFCHLRPGFLHEEGGESI